MNDIEDYDQKEAQTIGAWLCELREAKKMTIADVAAHLRLKEARVLAIEQDDYEEGMGAYLKGYVRAYAGLLDIDQELLDERLAALVVEERPYSSPMRIKSKVTSHLSWLHGMSRSWILLSVLLVLFLWVVGRSWANGHVVDDNSQRIKHMVTVTTEVQPADTKGMVKLESDDAVIDTIKDVSMLADGEIDATAASEHGN